MQTKAKNSHSRQLRSAIETAGSPLFLMYRQFWDHEPVGELLVPFLILMHQIVRSSVPLMQAASREAASSARTDGVCKLLHRYLESHIEEEADHDTWLLEDLACAGLKETDVLARPPSTAVAAMCGSQYYWIYHHHPVALLGYIRLLEGNPPSQAHIDRLKRSSGFPDSVFRTYRMHGALDPHHLQEFDDMFDALPLKPAQLDLVLASAVYTAHMMSNCLGEILFELEPRQAVAQ
jgi:hypothetical protein